MNTNQQPWFSVYRNFTAKYVSGQYGVFVGFEKTNKNFRFYVELHPGILLFLFAAITTLYVVATGSTAQISMGLIALDLFGCVIGTTALLRALFTTKEDAEVRDVGLTELSTLSLLLAAVALQQ